MIEKLVRQKLTIAGKEYEYPDTTALVGKINELADAVNELQMKVGHMEDGVVCKVFDNTNSKIQRDLEIAIDALNKIALVDDAGAQMVATAREALTKIGNITPR